MLKEIEAAAPALRGSSSRLDVRVLHNFAPQHEIFAYQRVAIIVFAKTVHGTSQPAFRPALSQSKARPDAGKSNAYLG
jgi:hypothetical protein